MKEIFNFQFSIFKWAFVYLLIGLRRYFVASALGAFVYLCISGKVIAQTLPQQSIQVSPIIQELTLIPGKTTSYTLTISNLADTPLGIHADVSGLQLDNDIPGQLLLPTQDSLLSRWTTIMPQDVIIPEHTKKTMVVKISPPSNAKESGYYTGIILTPFINQQEVPHEPIILSRIVALTVATIGTLNYNNLAKKTAITDFHFNSVIYDTNTIESILSVKNSYFTHFSAQPFLTISPLFGKKIAITPTAQHILPGKSRTWIIPTIVPNNHFFYAAHIAVSIGDGKQLTKDTFFFIIPYTPLFILFIVLLLFLSLTIFRKRIGKAIHVFVANG